MSGLLSKVFWFWALFEKLLWNFKTVWTNELKAVKNLMKKEKEVNGKLYIKL